MYLVSENDVHILMAGALFVLGLATFATGVFVLVARTMGKDLRTLTSQTAHLAQKGIAEDIAGLVGNASALLSGLTQLVKTAAGIGIFLTTLGLGLMGTGYWFLLQINWPAA